MKTTADGKATKSEAAFLARIAAAGKVSTREMTIAERGVAFALVGKGRITETRVDTFRAEYTIAS